MIRHNVGADTVTVWDDQDIPDVWDEAEAIVQNANGDTLLSVVAVSFLKPLTTRIDQDAPISPGNYTLQLRCRQGTEWEIISATLLRVVNALDDTTDNIIDLTEIDGGTP